MRTIIVINDNSAHAIHAAEVALYIAVKNNANLLLANLTPVNENKLLKFETVLNDGCYPLFEAGEEKVNLEEHLNRLNVHEDDFKPSIDRFDASSFEERDFSDYSDKHNVWMIIQGCGDMNTPIDMPSLNTYSLLNFIKCPLMFIPSTFTANTFVRAVYMADLRYGQPSVVRYMSGFLKNYHAHLLFAHLSASGLPDMELDYAFTLFKETIGSAIDYDQIAFNNVKERNMDKAIDVLVHGMSTDLLAVVNYQYHFKEVLGKYILLKQLPQISIPLMVFPF
jgi:hypothetical protein